MVITANQNRQPPQAPSTPVVTRQALSELVNYYRELAHFHRSSVDYHRQLLEQHVLDAEVAEKQLASIEAILHPLRTTQAPEFDSGDVSLTTESVNQDANGKQVNRTGIVTPSKDKAKDTVSEGASDTLAVREVTAVEPEPKKQLEGTATDVEKSEPEASKPVTQSSPKKKSSPKKNSKTSGQTTRRPKAHPKLSGTRGNADQESTSSKASKTKKPTKKKNTRPTKKPTPAFSSRLPYSEKLAASETVVDAVALCLQEYYPQVITAEELVKYYYPEGLDRETKKRANEAFSNCLSKGAGKKGWIRASIGKYRWKDEG